MISYSVDSTEVVDFAHSVSLGRGFSGGDKRDKREHRSLG